MVAMNIETTTVASIMSKGLVTASPSDTVGRVRGQLVHLPIGAVPVVEDGHLVGIVTLVDLHDAVYSAEEVRRHVVSPVVTIGPDATIAEAAQILYDKREHHAVVVEGDEPLGIVSTFDLVGLLR